MLEFLIGVAIGFLIALAIGYFEIMRKESEMANPTRDALINDRTICLWELENEGYYSTQCGNVHCFPQGTPSDNGLDFCPDCMKDIVVLNEEI